MKYALKYYKIQNPVKNLFKIRWKIYFWKFIILEFI